MVLQKGDDMVGSQHRTRYRRLEFVGYPARRVGIELGA